MIATLVHVKASFDGLHFRSKSYFPFAFLIILSASKDSSTLRLLPRDPPCAREIKRDREGKIKRKNERTNETMKGEGGDLTTRRKRSIK